MAYADTKFRKQNDIKVRLDDFDMERLEKYISRFGGEKAVIGRDAIIEMLDKANIPYDKPHLNTKLQERRKVISVKDGIRQLHKQLHESDQSELQLIGGKAANEHKSVR